MLFAASLLLITCAFLHSYMGEKHLIIRLFRRKDLPRIYGSTRYTRGTIRFAWHMTSVAWLGFAFLLATPVFNESAFLYTTGFVFLLSAILSAYYTKMKHFAWVLFTVISMVVFAAASL